MRWRNPGCRQRRESSTYVEVVKLQFSQSIIEGGFDMLGVVAVVPELGSNEDVFTFQPGNICQAALNPFANLLLVAVDLGQVEVAVASLDGFIDSVADLARCSLPSAITNSGHGMARVQGNGFPE